jgi:YidC/Oxa1 family membrane protein insertase
MEKRLVAAFALSFLIIMGWRWYLEKTLPPAPPKPAVTTKTTEPSPAKPVAAPSPAKISVDTEKEAKKETKLEVRQDNAVRMTEIETDLYRVVLSNQEGIVRNWVLKKYLDSNKKPLELVNLRATTNFGYPLAIKILGNDEANGILGKALFATNQAQKIELKGKEKFTLSFEYADSQLHALKEITFTAGSYLVDIHCQVWINGKPASYALYWKSGFGDTTVDPRTAVHESLYLADNSVNRLRADKVQKKINTQIEEAQKEQRTAKTELEFGGTIGYAGLNDQYFAAVFLPGNKDGLGSFLVGVDVNKTAEGKEETFLKAGVTGDSQERDSFRLFVGPKDAEILKQSGHRLSELINYGWFKFFCTPMFVTLKWLYSFTKNYGVAIILLTVIISMALLPLRIKSIYSAQKMQKLQPQLKAIQEKYKKLKATDPKKQQMNVEVMDLYKKHGVNPLGGCLPLLIQLPFFYAIYNLLSVSIELRQAPFIFWIKDLSSFDTTYILPILFTASMVLMQKMTPTPSADPIQAKMMMFMPLVFGFMLSATPSGLVLYWLTSNVVGIAQQLIMNKYGPGSGGRTEKAGKSKEEKK